MNVEPDFATLLADRRAAAENTIHPISQEELQALGAKLFPSVEHPWAATFAKFISEHPLEEALQGEVPDDIGFIYYPVTQRGIWYQIKDGVTGVGPLGELALKALGEIVAER